MNNKYFKELLEKFPENYYIGLGNPNSSILFISKEAGEDIGKVSYHGTVKNWTENKYNYFQKYIPENKKLLNLNHTWQRYQKLYELILNKLDIELNKVDKYEINFVENVFTTVLSHLPAKTTQEAKKQENFEIELVKRKKEFFKSNFIKNFQIVLIFANDNKYIETYPGEVCELFNVKYDGTYEYEGKDKIWIHSSNDDSKKKILIHTRQLTNSIGSELVNSLAEIVCEFVKKNELTIITNS
jgi:hypothetical protein